MVICWYSGNLAEAGAGGEKDRTGKLWGGKSKDGMGLGAWRWGGLC